MAESPVLQTYMKALAISGEATGGLSDSSSGCESNSSLSSTSQATPPRSPSSPALEPKTLDSEKESPLIVDSSTSSTSSGLFENPFFHTRPSPLGGYGSFAARDLRKGDVILRERPLLVSEGKDFYDRFDELSKSEKDVFETLCVSQMCVLGTPRAKAIWETNCFSISPSQSAIFPAASRFNHACHPACNVSYAYDPLETCLVMKVQAESIPKGQELTISYGSAWTPVMLYWRYGFRCRCGVCEGVADWELEAQW